MVYCAYYVHCALNGRCVSWLPGAQVKCWMLLTVYTSEWLSRPVPAVVCLLTLLLSNHGGGVTSGTGLAAFRSSCDVQYTLTESSSVCSVSSKRGLPQLAVSAKILCLLMVVICGAVPSMVRSVRLYNQCSHHYVNIINGTVMARSSEGDQPDLLISSLGIDLKLLIYSPKENVYICFSRRWKLVGRRISRREAQNTKYCLFKESMLAGYTTYSSVADVSRFIGFNQRGAPLRRPLPLMPQSRIRCITFIKENDGFDISLHNLKVARFGENAAPLKSGPSTIIPQRPLRRRHHPHPNNELTVRATRPPCPSKLRHSHSRHLRRKSCDAT